MPKIKTDVPLWGTDQSQYSIISTVTTTGDTRHICIVKLLNIKSFTKLNARQTPKIKADFPLSFSEQSQYLNSV